MPVDLTLNVIAIGETEAGRKLKPGDKVIYRGHVPGGVKIEMPDGLTDIAHHMCFKELR